MSVPSGSRHTPGPWTLSRASGGGMIVNRPGQSLQVVPVADAHLIASSPDLLEALKGIEDHFGDLLQTEAPDLRQMALAAIEKAEGR